jgi:hypothetical protein
MAFKAGAGYLLTGFKIALDDVCVIYVRNFFGNVCSGVVLCLRTREKVQDRDEDQQ